MKETIRTILSETAAFARGLSGDLTPNNIFPGHPAAKAAGGLAAVAFCTLAVGSFVVTETGLAVLAEVRRRRRIRAPHPESPSLRGTPTDKEIASDCAERPRTLLVRLRIGSRLADLSPTLDTDPHYDVSPTGARRIASRGPGLKGWLEDHRIATNYSTLSKYRHLATRLRLLLQLDERIPLEWLLPGAAPDRPLPPDLIPRYHAARRHLARLLRGNPNFTRLRKHVDAKLGIPELLRARRCAREGKSRRRAARASRYPVIRGATRRMTIDPGRIEATRLALAGFLQDKTLSPKFARLRDAAVRWLRAPPLF